MTAFPPPNSKENSDPNIVTSTLRFCLTMIQIESVTSNNVPMLVLIKLIRPCCAAERSSLEYIFVHKIISKSIKRMKMIKLQLKMIKKSEVTFVSIVHRWLRTVSEFIC